jgi:MFS family permease
MTPPRAEARAPWPVFVVVALGTFMSTLDSSIVNVALPTLQRAFRTSVSGIGWVSLAYLLTLTLLLLPFGRLGDAWGRRRIYLAGLALFVAGSLLCGLANSAAVLVASRVVQGVGASMVASNAAAIVTAVFPPAMRGRGLGSIGAVVGLGLTVGPPLGGFLLEAAGWRSIFLVNLPVGALALALGARLLPPDPAAAERAGLGRAPLLDGALLRDRRFAGALGAQFLAFVALFTAVFLAPFYLENVTGLTPGEVGRVLVVVPLLLFLVAPLAGALSDRVGTRRLAATGLTLNALGLLLLAGLVARAGARPAGVAEMVAGLFVVGLGQGVFQPPNSSAAMGAAPPSGLGLAGALVAAMRNLGMVVGIALAAFVYERSERAHRAGGLDAVSAAGLGLRDALLIGAAVAAVGIVLSLRGRGTATRS